MSPRNNTLTDAGDTRVLRDNEFAEQALFRVLARDLVALLTFLDL